MAFLVFCSLLWLLSSFYHRLCFSLLPLLSSAQLPLSCSINLPLLMSLFMCHLNWPARSHYLLGSVSNLSGKQFFPLPVTYSPLVIRFLIWSPNYLVRHRAKMNAITFPSSNFVSFVQPCITSAKNSTWFLINSTYLLNK